MATAQKEGAKGAEEPIMPPIMEPSAEVPGAKKSKKRKVAEAQAVQAQAAEADAAQAEAAPATPAGTHPPSMAHLISQLWSDRAGWSTCIARRSAAALLSS